MRTGADGGQGVDEVRSSDVLIVGSGVAGLAAALGCSGLAVTLLTKTRLGEGGSSAWAQGGVAVAVGDDDSPALHAGDTVAVAGGLADPAVVRLLTAEGPARIAELIRLGATFDREDAPRSLQSVASGVAIGRGGEGDPRDTDGGAAGVSAGRGQEPAPGAVAGPGPRLALGREAAHSRRRILHAGGDATGRELVRTLTAAVLAAPNVRVEEECFAVDLVLAPAAGSPDGLRRAAPPRRVTGVLALDRDGRRVLHRAAAVVLATGGSGQLYLHTTNPPEVTADGLAMAARAGARLADLEFVQFHPTALAADGGTGRRPLLTEALRGEGAVLVDGRGHRFLVDEHPDAELAPRDVVARAIHRRLAAGDRVLLDARRAIGDRFPERFPTVFAAARAAGLDPRIEPLPVVPAAHYHMGGMVTDARGRTSLCGLWACGETAATGVHGANRLASNSLLEGLVFGARVAVDIARGVGAGVELARVERATGAAMVRSTEGDRRGEVVIPGDETLLPVAAEDLRRRLRERMSADVGLLRDAAGLARAAAELRRLEAEAAELIARAELLLESFAVGGVLRHLLETRNLLTAGSLVTAAAEMRRESRGAHQRLDHPRSDPAWRRRVLVTARPGGAPLLALSAPVPEAEVEAEERILEKARAAEPELASTRSRQSPTAVRRDQGAVLVEAAR